MALAELCFSPSLLLTGDHGQLLYFSRPQFPCLIPTL